MTAKAVTAKARKGDTIVDRLREELGVRGVLVQMAKRRQIIELRCEMPNCYCHKGRAHFDPKSHPPGPVGTVARPLPEAQVRWRTPRRLERPALARALQPRGLCLAHAD